MPPTDRLPRVLFVAGLTPMPSGGIGGQGVAAQNLAASELARRVEFVPLTTTMQSVPPPPLAVRARRAAKRLGVFAPMVRDVDVALIFVADGWSLLEKGAMCVMARLAGRGVVVRFSSGLLPRQCEARPALLRALRILLRSTHVVICQSPTLARFFSQFPEAAGKVVIVPNGVVIGPPAKPPESRIRITFVGWIARDKGVFELIDAVDRIRHDVPTVELELVGGGANLADVQALIQARGLAPWIRTTGWVGHEAALVRLREAAIFALPTYYEGMPNALLEAMAAGIASIATPVGAIPDLVQDGHNGLLVGFRDVDALEKALRRLIASPEERHRIGSAARETMIHDHSMERVWKAYAAAISRAASETGRGPGVRID